MGGIWVEVLLVVCIWSEPGIGGGLEEVWEVWEVWGVLGGCPVYCRESQALGFFQTFEPAGQIINRLWKGLLG